MFAMYRYTSGVQFSVSKWHMQYYMQFVSYAIPGGGGGGGGGMYTLSPQRCNRWSLEMNKYFHPTLPVCMITYN